jgi:hypothetical protein
VGLFLQFQLPASSAPSPGVNGLNPTMTTFKVIIEALTVVIRRSSPMMRVLLVGNNGWLSSLAFKLRRWHLELRPIVTNATLLAVRSVISIASIEFEMIHFRYYRYALPTISLTFAVLVGRV